MNCTVIVCLFRSFRLLPMMQPQMLGIPELLLAAQRNRLISLYSIPNHLPASKYCSRDIEYNVSKVIQISKSHETYNGMSDDANTDRFSPLTSVRVWIGIRNTPGYDGRIRATRVPKSIRTLTYVSFTRSSSRLRNFGGIWRYD